MNNLLNESDSHYLYNEAVQSLRMANTFDIVKGTGASLGVDGDQYYYGVGHIAEPTGIFGFGKTPAAALEAFGIAFYSQTIKTK